jgi:hypothetical protein
MNIVYHAELVATQAHSLLSKLPNQYRLVSGLLESASGKIVPNSQHVAIQSIEERDAVHALFRDANAESQGAGFGFVDAEEYVLRATAARPFSSSRPTLSRLYAMLTSTEFRLATVMSSDDGW